MFSIKKLIRVTLKKNIRSEEPTYFLFCSESRQKSPYVFFSIKRLANYSSRRTRDFFFVVFVLFFYESREKRSELNMETKTTIRPDSPPPDPVSPAVLYSLPDKAWQYNPLLPKEFKILRVDVMSQFKKILIFMFNTVLFKIPAVSMLSGSAYRYMDKLLNL